MRAHATGANKNKARDERDRGQRVEQGIECGEKRELRARDVGRRVIIDEPEQEQAGDRADRDDTPRRPIPACALR